MAAVEYTIPSLRAVSPEAAPLGSHPTHPALGQLRKKGSPHLTSTGRLLSGSDSSLEEKGPRLQGSVVPSAQTELRQGQGPLRAGGYASKKPPALAAWIKALLSLWISVPSSPCPELHCDPQPVKISENDASWKQTHPLPSPPHKHH